MKGGTVFLQSEEPTVWRIDLGKQLGLMVVLTLVQECFRETAVASFCLTSEEEQSLEN